MIFSSSDLPLNNSDILRRLDLFFFYFFDFLNMRSIDFSRKPDVILDILIFRRYSHNRYSELLSRDFDFEVAILTLRGILIHLEIFCFNWRGSWRLFHSRAA